MYCRRRLIRGAARIMLAALVMPVLPMAAWADGLASPTGEVILTLDGNIGRRNAPDGADFDLAMLRALPSASFRTATPWTEGAADFEGVPLEEVLKAAAATGKTIKAAALNDYIADVDVETAVSAGAILAYRINGAEISVREKGPLWIMFPFDDKPQLKSELVYSQSVWQLRKMTVLD